MNQRSGRRTPPGRAAGVLLAVPRSAANHRQEFTFGALGPLGLVPADRAAKVTSTGITCNYTTILNILFLLVAAALLARFVRSGGAPMLKMMGGSPAGHEQVRGDIAPQETPCPAGLTRAHAGRMVRWSW